MNRSRPFHIVGRKADGRASPIARLTGILFVIRSGIPWRMLPQELGCGSGMTCWRRLRDRQRAGVWDLIHFALLDWLARNDQIDWSRAAVDSCSIRARMALVGSSGCLGGGLTCPAEISITEESDKNDHHKRREKELAPGKKERRREHQ